MLCMDAHATIKVRYMTCVRSTTPERKKSASHSKDAEPGIPGLNFVFAAQSGAESQPKIPPCVLRGDYAIILDSIESARGITVTRSLGKRKGRVLTRDTNRGGRSDEDKNS